MASATEVSKIMAILSAAYPRFNSNASTIAAYHEMLKDIPAETLKVAALYCANNSEFFPSVYEIRSAVAEINRQAQNIPNMYQAWDEILRMPRQMEGSRIVEEDGKYIIEKYQVSFSHPLVEHVAKMMGWPKFPSSDEISVDRAHFFKAYDHMMRDAMKESIKLPEVKAYIESHKVAKLEARNDG